MTDQTNDGAHGDAAATSAQRHGSPPQPDATAELPAAGVGRPADTTKEEQAAAGPAPAGATSPATPGTPTAPTPPTAPASGEAATPTAPTAPGAAPASGETVSPATPAGPGAGQPAAGRYRQRRELRELARRRPFQVGAAGVAGLVLGLVLGAGSVAVVGGFGHGHGHRPPGTADHRGPGRGWDRGDQDGRGPAGDDGGPPANDGGPGR